MQTEIKVRELWGRRRAWTEYLARRWVRGHLPNLRKITQVLKQVLVGEWESWTDSVTYWSGDSCVVRVINEPFVENKTLVLLGAKTKQTRRHTHQMILRNHKQAFYIMSWQQLWVSPFTICSHFGFQCLWLNYVLGNYTDSLFIYTLFGWLIVLWCVSRLEPSTLTNKMVV